MQEHIKEFEDVRNIKKQYDEYVNEWTLNDLREAYNILLKNNFSNSTLDEYFSSSIYLKWKAKKVLVDSRVSTVLAGKIQKKEWEIKESIRKIQNLFTTFNDTYISESKPISGLHGALTRVGEWLTIWDIPKQVYIEYDDAKENTLEEIKAKVELSANSMISYIESLQEAKNTVLESEKISAYKKLQDELTLVSNDLITALKELIEE